MWRSQTPVVGNWGSGAAVRHSSGDENVKDGGGGAFGAAAKTPSSRRETDCCFYPLTNCEGNEWPWLCKTK